jgi:integrase
MVGGEAGLGLQITASQAKSWILRTTVFGKRRDFGLGAYPSVGLAKAREAAQAIKAEIRQGVDPIEKKKQERQAKVVEKLRSLTFKQAVDEFLVKKLNHLRNLRGKKDWGRTLERYALPDLGPMRVDEIQSRDVLRILTKDDFWTKKHVTASRVLNRIEKILDWATAMGHRSGDNPARWKGNMRELLPTVAKGVTHSPAMNPKDAPAWFAALRQLASVDLNARKSASLVLEFLALTGTRMNEACGALWSEMDLEAGLWNIPASRMKKGRDHRVPLSTQALALLEQAPRFYESDVVFLSPRGKVLDGNYVRYLMTKLHDTAGPWFDPVSGLPARPHGLRSTFRQWAADQSYPRELAEQALAHQIGSAVELAYQRSDMVERRRTMMQNWANYLEGHASANVVAIHA